jgi:hypothetical protein
MKHGFSRRVNGEKVLFFIAAAWLVVIGLRYLDATRPAPPLGSRADAPVPRTPLQERPCGLLPAGGRDPFEWGRTVEPFVPVPIEVVDLVPDGDDRPVDGAGKGVEKRKSTPTAGRNPVLKGRIRDWWVFDERGDGLYSAARVGESLPVTGHTLVSSDGSVVILEDESGLRAPKLELLRGWSRGAPGGGLPPAGRQPASRSVHAPR